MKRQSGRRLTAIVLTALLLATGVPAVYGATPPADVAGTRYEAAVNALIDAGVVSGYPDGTFRPQAGVTRAEACVMIVRSLRSTADDLAAAQNRAEFRDLAGYDWAVPSIRYAAGKGIVRGYPDGAFRPGSAVTHNETAAMLVFASGVKTAELSGVWPNNVVRAAESLGMLQDVPFGGNEPASRGDVAFMLYRVRDRIAAAKLPDVALPTAPAGTGSPIPSTDAPICPDMTFTGTPIALSLAEAIRVMQTTGSRAETARLNRTSDQAIAAGYSEDLSTLVDFLRKIDESGDTMPLEALYELQQKGITENARRVLDLRRTFAYAHITDNYNAEQNSIKRETVQKYCGTLLARENLKAAQGNEAVAKTFLANVQSRYRQGMVAKTEATAAELAYAQAGQQTREAGTAFCAAAMELNILLGYPVMQQVRLTESPAQIARPPGTQADWVAAALKNRNEIRYAQFLEQVQKMLFDHIAASYSSSSATCLKQEAAWQMARKAGKDAPLLIEAEIRGKYLALADQATAVEVARQAVSAAADGSRIAMALYNAGKNTAVDVQKAQVAAYRAEIGLASALTNYNLTVYDVQSATAEGTQRMSL